MSYSRNGTNDPIQQNDLKNRHISSDSLRAHSTNHELMIDRNKSNDKMIKYIMKQYSQEIEREKEREPSTVSYMVNDYRMDGRQDPSDNLYMDSILNISDMHISECEREITNESKIDRSLYTKDSVDKILEERLDQLIKEHQESHTKSLVKDNSEHMDHGEKLSYEIDDTVSNNEVPNVYQSDVSSIDMFRERVIRENSTHSSYAKDNETEAEDRRYHISNEYMSQDNDSNMYEKQQEIEIPYIPTGQLRKMNTNESDLPAAYDETLTVMPQMNKIRQYDNCSILPDISVGSNYSNNEKREVSAVSEVYSNAFTDQVKIYNADDIDSQLEYSVGTVDSMNPINLNMNMCHLDTPQRNITDDSNRKSSNYRAFIEFMRKQSLENSRSDDMGETYDRGNNRSFNNGCYADISLHNLKALERRCESENFAKNKPERKLKTYSLADMKSGKVEIPKNIFMPLPYNVSGNNIMESYQKNERLQKFMKDCNDSVNLILKYPQAQTKQPSVTRNMPVSMTSVISQNIGLPVVYEDKFDRKNYHPNVKNLHMGSIFEKHVFNMMKNKKNLGKKIYTESNKYEKYNYDKKNGFWISNVSKDRLVNPEKNDSYITELVYEKHDTYEDGIRDASKCPNFNKIVPSLQMYYENNNFFKFLNKEGLYECNNPTVATIMRRFDIMKVSNYETTEEIPGITPVHNMN